MRRSWLLLLLVLLCAAPARPAAAADYFVRNLGTLGGAESRATAVNNSGQVVGYSTTASGSVHAFLWNPTTPNGNVGKIVDLGTLGGQSCRAYGINNLGQVVGVSDVVPGARSPHAFLWTPVEPNGSTGTMTDLGTLCAEPHDPAECLAESAAYGIDDNGRVVGMATLELWGVELPQPFLWESGTMSAIGTLGGASGWATAVSLAGFAGTSYDASNVYVHGFGPGLQDLGTLSGQNGWANAINSTGQVAGAATLAGNLIRHAFRTSPGSPLTPADDLGTLGGTANDVSVALGINDHDGDGQVVGWSTLAGKPRAFVWDSGFGMRDLAALVAPGSGLVLREALDINDSISNPLYPQIVGNATNSAGRFRAFLMVPIGVNRFTLARPSITGSKPLNATARIEIAAPPGGVTVSFSSSDPSVAWPAAATAVVPEGAISVIMSIKTAVVATSASVVLSATANGVRQSATLQVTPPSLSNLTLSANPVTGGKTLTGTVTLNAPAPAGGFGVLLSSSDAALAATAVSNVIVAEGSQSATFTITTTPVPAATPVVLSASAAGVTKPKTLTVNPPGLSALSLWTTAVLGSKGLTGTVTLNGKAPAGGFEVTLNSGNPAAARPTSESVTVAAGSTTATFDIVTFPVAAVTQVDLTAAAGGVTRTKTLTVNPPGVVSLTLAPTTVVGSNAATGTVTLACAAAAGGITVTLSNGRPAVAAAPASVTVPEGATSAAFPITTSPVSTTSAASITATASGKSASATLTVQPSRLTTLTLSPNPVPGGSAVTGTVGLDGDAPAGGIAVSLASDAAVASPASASVTIAAGARTATFGITTTTVTSDQTATITASAGGATKSETLKVLAIGIDRIDLSPDPATGGQTVDMWVTLTQPAPAGGALVKITSSDPALARPSQDEVLIGEGEVSTSPLFVTTSAVKAETEVCITATYAGAGKTEPLTLLPIRLDNLSLDQSEVYGGVAGTGATGTVNLVSPAPAGGVDVRLSSSDEAVAWPKEAVLHILEGAMSGTFVIETAPVDQYVSVTFTAEGDGTGNSVENTLSVKPVEVSTITLSASSVVAGQSVTGTVELECAAPVGGRLVQLAGGAIAWPVPDQVLIPAGQKTGTFIVETMETTDVLGIEVIQAWISEWSPVQTATLLVETIVPTSLTVSVSEWGWWNDWWSWQSFFDLSGTVTLSGKAPVGGLWVTLGSDSGLVQGDLYIPEGSDGGSFYVSSQPGPPPYGTQVWASFNGWTVYGTL
jgi:probable HAF family extracellular repeat protein